MTARPPRRTQFAASSAVRGAPAVSITTSGPIALLALMPELSGGRFSLSDSSGTIFDKDGITQDKLDWVKELKKARRGRIKEYAEKVGAEYFEGESPWKVKCDAAFPSATQNELDLELSLRHI